MYIKKISYLYANIKLEKLFANSHKMFNFFLQKCCPYCLANHSNHELLKTFKVSHSQFGYK